MPDHSHPPVDKRISICIPCYNSGHTILELISGIKKVMPYNKILIVNDGSTDQTESIAHSSRAHIISTSQNKGKGSAILTGMNALKNSEWMICMDADLQHDPEDLKSFVDAIDSEQFDLIVGYRKRTGTDMPFARMLSNSITSFLLSVRLGIKIKDAQCGFRAIKISSSIKHDFKEKRYMFETEYLIRSALGKQKIGWVPVKTIYNESKSYIRPWVDTFKFVTLWFKSFAW
jgi:glycosyltransferase involved in cell wall biosynthesis